MLELLVYEPDLGETFSALSKTPPEVSFANLITACKLLASSKYKMSINESKVSFLETLLMNVCLSLISFKSFTIKR